MCDGTRIWAQAVCLPMCVLSHWAKVCWEGACLRWVGAEKNWEPLEWRIGWTWWFPPPLRLMFLSLISWGDTTATHKIIQECSKVGYNPLLHLVAQICVTLGRERTGLMEGQWEGWMLWGRRGSMRTRYKVGPQLGDWAQIKFLFEFQKRLEPVIIHLSWSNRSPTVFQTPSWVLSVLCEWNIPNPCTHGVHSLPRETDNSQIIPQMSK